MLMPAWAKDHSTRPEQSKEDGPAAPHTYGRPRLLSAARSALVSWAAVNAPPPRVPGTSPTGDPPPGRLTPVPSGSPDPPFGSPALIPAASQGALARGAVGARLTVGEVVLAGAVPAAAGARATGTAIGVPLASALPPSMGTTGPIVVDGAGLVRGIGWAAAAPTAAGLPPAVASTTPVA